MSQQKTVVITGANKGIGLEFVRFYQKAGWHDTAYRQSKS